MKSLLSILVELNLRDQPLTHFLVRSEKKVAFCTYKGHWTVPFPPQSSLVKSWVYDNPAGIPEPGREQVRFNL